MHGKVWILSSKTCQPPKKICLGVSPCLTCSPIHPQLKPRAPSGKFSDLYFLRVSNPTVHPDSEVPLSPKSHGPSRFGAFAFFQTLWSIQTQSSHHFPDPAVHQILHSHCRLNLTDHPGLEFPIPYKPHRPSRLGDPTFFQIPQSIRLRVPTFFQIPQFIRLRISTVFQTTESIPIWSFHSLPNPTGHQAQSFHHIPNPMVCQTQSHCFPNPMVHPHSEFPLFSEPHGPSRVGVPTVFQTPRSIQTWGSHRLPNPTVHPDLGFPLSSKQSKVLITPRLWARSPQGPFSSDLDLMILAAPFQPRIFRDSRDELEGPFQPKPSWDSLKMP
ncbi:uncharacterized protein LOC119701334 [Motacilla alba alba]|uniref:uncharacterized protein LOC119701334 n=1 Tax=Motacilla alba alba TaxID=1094192 RepID=UPI0018D5863D|nr:uncharacterized protein LOC119701334 [Motacilla alba alba]